MARYVLLDDLVFEGLPYSRGDILNAPQELPEVQRLLGLSDVQGVPRVRIAGLQHNFSAYYLPVPQTEQLGWQTADAALPLEGTIKEPVLPAANTQYD